MELMEIFKEVKRTQENTPYFSAWRQQSAR